MEAHDIDDKLCPPWWDMTHDEAQALLDDAELFESFIRIGVGWSTNGEDLLRTVKILGPEIRHRTIHPIVRKNIERLARDHASGVRTLQAGDLNNAIALRESMPADWHDRWLESDVY